MLNKQRLPPPWLAEMRPAGYFSQTKHLPGSDLKHDPQPSTWGKGEVCDEQIISSGTHESQGLSLSSLLICFVFKEGGFEVWHGVSCSAQVTDAGCGPLWSSAMCGLLLVAMAIESLPSQGWKMLHGDVFAGKWLQRQRCLILLGAELPLSISSVIEMYWPYLVRLWIIGWGWVFFRRQGHHGILKYISVLMWTNSHFWCSVFLLPGKDAFPSPAPTWERKEHIGLS